jgi:Ca-activated chloride channel family protein
MRRHVPAVLFMLALMLMVAAIARPVAELTLPSEQDTVILAMDVSGSMRATDVAPTRMAAAQAAARSFVSGRPRATRVGVVSFAGTAALVQAPTDRRDDILVAIDRFQMQSGTAIGSGIVTSLKSLFPGAKLDLPASDGRREVPNQAAEQPANPSVDTVPQGPKAVVEPVPPGSNKSAVIILISDGQTNTGPDPLVAARLAAERGVRIFTIGIGTSKGAVLTAEGWSMRVRLDETALKTIANMTRGQYFYAGSAPDLKKVYEGLDTRLRMETKKTEITALVSAAAALLLLASSLASLWWFDRIF